MHFLDSWTELSALAFARLMIPPACLAVAAFLPGRRVARFTAVIVALFMPFLREVGPFWPFGLLWALLWVGVAWRAGDRTGVARRPLMARISGVESGTVGLLLGLTLLAFLIAAVARQDLSPEEERRASYALLVMCLGLLHLMLRRDAARAVLAFAVLGLGLQVLDSVAHSTLLVDGSSDPGHVLVATAAAVTLVDRLARVRVRDAGSPWVGDAHDLHD